MSSPLISRAVPDHTTSESYGDQRRPASAPGVLSQYTFVDCGLAPTPTRGHRKWTRKCVDHRRGCTESVTLGGPGAEGRRKRWPGAEGGERGRGWYEASPSNDNLVRLSRRRPELCKTVGGSKLCPSQDLQSCWTNHDVASTICVKSTTPWFFLNRYNLVVILFWALS